MTRELLAHLLVYLLVITQWAVTCELSRVARLPRHLAAGSCMQGVSTL
jgi:hypothetical protein